MPRYIDAEAMIRKICGMKCGCERYECGYDEAGCPKVRDIETAPTVSPDEVRGVGHWVTEQEAIDANDYSLRDTCSVCGHCDWDCTESASFKYCPNCGARMEVSEDA